MTSIFYSGLSKDFSLLLNNADDFNVIIQVGEVNNTKEFRAHSVILRARSPYFKSALSNEWITKRNDMIVFNKPNITPLIFDMVLKYIYTGELNLKKYSGENILELLIASDELILEELFEHIQDYLINNQTSWIQENFVLVLHTVFKLVSCKKLQDYCLESICTDPRPFITSKNFPSLDKDILYGLLKRDDMQIDEVSVWDSLIKWGIEQTPGLGTLPKTFTLSPRVGKIRIESDIIKPILIPTIINWINKREAKSFLNKNDSSYKFNLIYRGSIDGIDSNLFRNRCKSQEPILILVKCQNLKKIFGGYTPVGFYRYLSNNNDDNQNMKISRVTSHNYAIYNNYYDGYGFSFGSGDLYMEEESLCVDNSGGYYEHNLNSYGTYTIEEIEAFRVVKQ
ncbi:hypothetical protein GLOIN_2v1480795 [Rhizophagus irregularis DAOM 181602=DAOM 197198]|nr:hypothetical protein GLOIN_2v1480795 [Rhizophagus irregularis DAOM 181602=DAOM 197198]